MSGRDGISDRENSGRRECVQSSRPGVVVPAAAGEVAAGPMEVRVFVGLRRVREACRRSGVVALESRTYYYFSSVATLGGMLPRWSLSPSSGAPRLYGFCPLHQASPERLESIAH